jgi:transcriptional regulator with XRE-family HTH domain
MFVFDMTAATPTSQLPPRITRSLVKLGRDIEVARKKRRLTISALCERAGISAPLYARLVAGAPGTSVGAYAMVLFALGMGTPFDSLMEVAKDDTGLLLEEERLPKRVRHPRNQSGAL